MLAQVTNGAYNAQRAQPTFKCDGLFGNYGLHMLHFLHSQMHTCIDTGLQVIQVIEMHARQVGNCWIDVTWEGDVYKKQGSSRTLLHHLLHEFDGDDSTWSYGGSDHYIRLHQSFRKFGKTSLFHAKTLCEVNRMCLGAINDDEPLCTIIAQVLGRKFAHLPRPYK